MRILGLKSNAGDVKLICTCRDTKEIKGNRNFIHVIFLRGLNRDIYQFGLCETVNSFRAKLDDKGRNTLMLR